MRRTVGLGLVAGWEGHVGHRWGPVVAGAEQLRGRRVRGPRRRQRLVAVARWRRQRWVAVARRGGVRGHDDDSGDGSSSSVGGGGGGGKRGERAVLVRGSVM